jgi:hypothetical protein
LLAEIEREIRNPDATSQPTSSVSDAGAADSAERSRTRSASKLGSPSATSNPTEDSRARFPKRTTFRVARSGSLQEPGGRQKLPAS